MSELRPSRPRSNSNRTSQLRGKSMSKKNKVDLFDLFMPVVARTEHQKTALVHYSRGDNLLLTGCAGTGKTFLALGLALDSIKRQQYKQIIIVRSAVATRDIGYLPGNLKDKMSEYERPYSDICTKLFNCADSLAQPFRRLSGDGIIQLMSTSYVRGVTIDNAVVILDEFQNMTEHEIYSVLTRIGDKCRVIISGDIEQTDLRGSTGFRRLVATLDLMNTFTTINFTIDDVVRSEFAKQFMIQWTGTEQVNMSNGHEAKSERVSTQPTARADKAYAG